MRCYPSAFRGGAAWFFAIGFCLAAFNLHAAQTFAWSTPVPFNGLTATQILTAPTGSIVGAASFGNAAPVTVTLTGNYAPVVFGGYKDPTVASVSASTALTYGAGAYPASTGASTANANMDSVLNQYATNGNPVTITLINLTAGATYSVQLFSVDDRSGGSSTNVSFQNPSDNTDISTAFTESSNSYVIGTFTVPSGATSVTIQQNLSSASGVINALVVRAISFTPAINFTVQPSPQSLDLGDTATFSALATGPAPLTPQWQSGPSGGPYTNLTDNGHISGSSTYNLTINGVTGSDASVYYVCTLTSGSATATSKQVSLTALGNSGPVLYGSPGSDVNGLLGVAYNNGGGTVVLSAGTYYGSINMYPNTTLKGAGMGSTIIVGTLTQGYYGANMIMEDLTVTGGVSATSYSAGNTPPAGIFFGDYSFDSYFLTWKNVEVTSTNIAMQLVNVNGCNLIGCNFHDSGLGFSHSIYFTGDYNINMSNSISSWSYAGYGAHLDFAGSQAYYGFNQCEFDGNSGFGILCQDNNGDLPTFQMAGSRVQYNGQDGGSGDGLNLSGNGAVQTSRVEFNNGYGVNNNNNIALVYFFTQGNAGGPFFSYGTVADWIDGVNSTFYYAQLADGVTGPNNTADWIETDGGNGMGAVDFNNNHSTNGAITWRNVSAPAAGVYAMQFIYSNGSSNTLAMPMTVNGTYAGTVLFPPTGGWSTYSTASLNATLTSNNNSVRLNVLSPGLGSPVINALDPIVGSISAPGAVTGLTAVADNTAPLLAMVTWIKLSWNPTPGATDYNVYRNGLPIAVGVSGTTFTDKHILGSHVTETYYVGAANAGGDGPAASITATSLTGYPLSLSASANPDYIELTCASSPGAVSYNVYRSQTSGGPYTEIGSSATTSYTDISVVNGTTYYYVMTATDGVSESLDSPQASATASVPVVYTGPTVLLDVDFGNAQTQTGAAVLGAANDIWNKAAASANTLVNSGGSTISGVSLGLTDYGPFTDGTANMDAATTALMRDFVYGYTATSVPNVTAALNGLSAFNGAPFTLVIYSGQGGASPTSMNITSGGSGGNTASTLNATGASRKISAGIGVAYNTFTGTISGSSLTFTDSPQSGQSFSAMNGFQLMLSAAPAPAAATALTASASNGDVSLSWSAASGANYYSIGRSSTSGGPYTNVGNAAGTSFTDASGVDGQTYYYVVYSVNAAGPGIASNEASANTAGLPASQQSLDVGTVSTPGTVYYNSGVYSLKSSGAGLTGAADSYRAVDETVTGDCEISARVVSLSASGQSAQAGVVIRETLNANAAMAATVLAPSAVQFLDRSSTGASTAVANSTAVSGAPYWVALKRAGNVFSSFISPDGANWTLTGTATIPMASTVHLGLAVASGSASIDNVVDHVSVPTAPPNLAAVPGLGKVTLSWGTPLDAVTYSVMRASASAGPFTVVASGLAANSYSDFPAASGTAYYYTVSATDALGVSPNSSVVSATPQSTIPLSNYSFENPVVSDGYYETTSIPGWGWYTNGGAAYAVINPGAPGATEPWPSTNPPGVDGSNFAQIYVNGTNGGNGIIYQDTGIKYQAGVTYSLTAAFGLQTYQTLASGATMFFGNSGLSNLGSKSIVAGNLSSGAFVDQTVNYTGTGSEAAGNGGFGAAGDIIIAFYIPSVPTGSYLDFDNVRLNAVPTSYAAYQQQYFNASQLSNPSISGASGDANGDGVSNLLAAALGLNPWTNATASLPVLGTSGGHLTLTFTRLKLPTTWTITVQVSGDLVNWESGPAYTTQTSVTPVNTTVEQATFQDNTPMAGNAPRFMRLKVTTP